MSAIIDDNTTDMAMEETLISPRFYTTNYKELDKIDVSSIRDEWDPLIKEMRSDPNKRHFQKTSEWDDFDFKDLLQLQICFFWYNNKQFLQRIRHRI